MQIQSYCKADKVYQLQILVKKFNLRWMFNPYSTDTRYKDAKWRVGIDYNGVSKDKEREFDLAWSRMETPIVELVRKYSFYHKVKVSFRNLLGK